MYSSSCIHKNNKKLHPIRHQKVIYDHLKSAMDLDDAITIAKIKIQDGKCFLMVGWQTNSFEIYIYVNEILWKGRFSPKRIIGFSKNLHMNATVYFEKVKHSLSQQRKDYIYELKSGFFYWKRKLNDQVIIEGFLPVDIVKGQTNVQPDLVEVLLTLNKHLKDKVEKLQNKFETTKLNYQRCLSDTEEFLNLKVDMEKALCEKFLNLLEVKKTKLKDNSQDKVKLKERKTLENFGSDVSKPIAGT